MERRTKRGSKALVFCFMFQGSKYLQWFMIHFINNKVNEWTEVY